MNIFHEIILKISDAPDSQVSDRIRQKCSSFIKEPRSESECYDLLDSISKEPCGEISSFIQTLCNVTKYYPKPGDANGKQISESLQE